MAAIAGAAIAAGAMLHAQHRQEQAQGAMTKQAREYDNAWKLHQDYVDQRIIRRRVADAKAAGIHPLFALGGSTGGSPTFSSMGYPATGSASGAGIAGAGRAIQRGLAQHGANKLALAEESRRQELHEAQMRASAHNDWMDQQERASILKRAEQGANTGARMTPDGAVVVPLSPQDNATLNPLPKDRPTRQEPNVNAPKWTELVDKYGRKIKVYSETAQADELNQFLIYSQELFNMMGGVDQVLRKWQMSPTEAGKQAWALFQSAKRKRSQAYIHKKGRRSQGYRPAVPLP